MPLLFLGGSYMLQTGDRTATAYGLQNLGVMQETSQDSGGSRPGSETWPEQRLGGVGQ